jgi:hypothetical protein
MLILNIALLNYYVNIDKNFDFINYFSRTLEVVSYNNIIFYKTNISKRTVKKFGKQSMCSI